MAEQHRPLVATDAVVFSGEGPSMKVLLITRKNEPFAGKLALPGGYLEAQESAEQCAARELKEETGLDGVLLTQLATFTDPNRDPRGRTLSIAFFGLVDDKKAATVRAGSDAASAKWVAVSSLTHDQLAFDHWRIFSLAKERMEPDDDY